MEDIELSVKERTKLGRGTSKRLRASGSIPAVLYGVSGSRCLSVEKSIFLKVWKKAGQSSVITIKDDKGVATMTLIQETQRDALTDEFVHIDFLELTKDHAITANIPLHVHGEAVGVKTEGGVLETPTHEVEIRCLPKNLPHQIDVDVSDLHVGDVIHLSNLPALEGVEYLGDPDQPIVAITAQAQEEEEPEEEVDPSEVPASKVAADDADDEKESKDS
jgi:large subunit ribosomal protein L25